MAVYCHIKKCSTIVHLSWWGLELFEIDLYAFIYIIEWVKIFTLFWYVLVLYTHLPYHNDSIIKTDAHRKTHEERKQEWRTHDKDTGRKTQEDFFSNIFTSHFIVRVPKGCSRFACERVLETEHKLHILTPLLWPSRCVFLVLLMLGSTPSGVFRGPPRSGVVFPTTSGL